MPSSPAFVISLDFELMWGVRDVVSIAQYGRNILGVREAIPAMLALFRTYEVRATWAAVGLLLSGTKKDLLDALPTIQPTYRRPEFSPYPYLASIGENEQSDPYHYGLSLARRIVDCEGMELGSHTFCHYYSLEDGQTEQQFHADLEASIAATERLGVRPVSLVFPRNQYNASYLEISARLGFQTYRGNETSWYYQKHAGEQESHFKRGCRLVDSYANCSGHNGFFRQSIASAYTNPHGNPHNDSPSNSPSIPSNLPYNIPSSRFLRPYSSRTRMLHSLQLRRITRAMTDAAAMGQSFHLWWHPHNFGVHLAENLAGLEQILRHSRMLRDQYGVTSMTMAEAALPVHGGTV